MTYDKHTDKPPHVELYLAGDFSSPFEVLTANDFSASQKREISNAPRWVFSTLGAALGYRTLAEISSPRSRWQQRRANWLIAIDLNRRWVSCRVRHARTTSAQQ